MAKPTDCFTERSMWKKIIGYAQPKKYGEVVLGERYNRVETTNPTEITEWFVLPSDPTRTPE